MTIEPPKPIPNYDLNESTIKYILNLLDKNESKDIFYVGYLKKELVNTLQDKYNLVTYAYHKSLNGFYIEGSDDIPKYDTLLLDEDVQWDFNINGNSLPNNVIIFGERGRRKTFRYFDRYDWSYVQGVHHGKYVLNDKTKLNETVLDTLLLTLSIIKAKKVFYLGLSRPDLILAIKDKYELVVADWFDRTNKSAIFWYEREEEEGYPCPTVPEWAKDINVQIEGIPKHDTLIIDMGNIYFDFKKNNHELPLNVIFIDDEDYHHSFDMFRYRDEYEWYRDNGFYVGHIDLEKLYQDNYSMQIYKNAINARNHESNNVDLEKEIDVSDDSLFNDPEGKFNNLVERVKALEEEPRLDFIESELSCELKKSFPNYEFIESLILNNSAPLEVLDVSLIDDALNILYSRYNYLEEDLQECIKNIPSVSYNRELEKINKNKEDIQSKLFVSLLFSSFRIPPVSQHAYYYVLNNLLTDISISCKEPDKVLSLLDSYNTQEYIKEFQEKYELVSSKESFKVSSLLIKISSLKKILADSYSGILTMMEKHITSGAYLIVNPIHKIFYNYIPERPWFSDIDSNLNYIEIDLYVYSYVKNKLYYEKLEAEIINKLRYNRIITLEITNALILQDPKTAKHIMNIFYKDYGKEELFKAVKHVLDDMYVHSIDSIHHNKDLKFETINRLYKK